jgi:hypothetical protein
VWICPQATAGQMLDPRASAPDRKEAMALLAEPEGVERRLRRLRDGLQSLLDDEGLSGAQPRACGPSTNPRGSRGPVATPTRGTCRCQPSNTGVDPDRVDACRKLRYWGGHANAEDGRHSGLRLVRSPIEPNEEVSLVRMCSTELARVGAGLVLHNFTQALCPSPGAV